MKLIYGPQGSADLSSLNIAVNEAQIASNQAVQDSLAALDAAQQAQSEVDVVEDSVTALQALNGADVIHKADQDVPSIGVINSYASGGPPTINASSPVVSLGKQFSVVTGAVVTVYIANSTGSNWIAVS